MEGVIQDARRVKRVGIGLIVFGVIAILAPLITGVAMAIWVGAVVLVSGVVRVTHAVQSEQGKARTHGLVLGGLAALCGLLMVLNPVFALVTVALLLAVWLGLDGLSKISMALQIRPRPGWGWTMFAGVISLLLGVLLLSEPWSGPWVIPTYVGIWGIFSGWALVNAAGAMTEAAPSGAS